LNSSCSTRRSKTLEVEAAEVASVQEEEQIRRNVGEPLLIHDIGVRYWMYSGRTGGNRDARIQSAGVVFSAPVGQHLEHAEFDDAVALRVRAGRL
jgi:hypothetical protein